MIAESSCPGVRNPVQAKLGRGSLLRVLGGYEAAKPPSLPGDLCGCRLFHPALSRKGWLLKDNGCEEVNHQSE